LQGFSRKGFGEEHLLLQLAAQIEKAEPWSNKRPPGYG